MAESRLAVHTVLRSLPGRALSAAALVNGTLWLIVDPSKDANVVAGAGNFAVTLIGGGIDG